MEILERESGAQLDFAAWSHSHGNSAELRGIDETVRRTEIDFVQGVESFAAELEIESFGNAKRALQSDVYGLYPRAVNGVPPGVSIGKSNGSDESSGIEPLVRGVGSRTEDWLTSDIRANGIFAEDRA